MPSGRLTVAVIVDPEAADTTRSSPSTATGRPAPKIRTHFRPAASVGRPWAVLVVIVIVLFETVALPVASRVNDWSE